MTDRERERELFRACHTGDLEAYKRTRGDKPSTLFEEHLRIVASRADGPFVQHVCTLVNLKKRPEIILEPRCAPSINFLLSRVLATTTDPWNELPCTILSPLLERGLLDVPPARVNEVLHWSSIRGFAAVFVMVAEQHPGNVMEDHLDSAASAGCVDIVTYLLPRVHRDNYISAMQRACERNHVAIAKLLSQHDPSLVTLEYFGHACRSPDVFDWLLQYPTIAAVDNYDEWLEFACRADTFRAARAFLQTGRATPTTDCIRFAVYNCSPDLLQLLLADGRAVPDNWCMQTAARLRDNLAVVRILLADPRLDPRTIRYEHHASTVRVLLTDTRVQRQRADKHRDYVRVTRLNCRNPAARFAAGAAFVKDT